MAARLSAQRMAFCREYVIDFDKEAAYTRAGYKGTGKTRRTNAARMLQNASVAAEIQHLKTLRDEADAKTHAEVIGKSRLRLIPLLNEIETLADSNITHYVITDEGQVTLAPGAPPDAFKAISSFRKKTRVYLDGSRTYEVWLTLWDKLGAVRMGMQHFGALTEKKEITGKDGGQVDVQFTYDELRKLPPDELARRHRETLGG